MTLTLTLDNGVRKVSRIIPLSNITMAADPREALHDQLEELLWLIALVQKNHPVPRTDQTAVPGT